LRVLPDELQAGQSIEVEALAHNVALLPDKYEGPPTALANDLLNFFAQSADGAVESSDTAKTADTDDIGNHGGTIEAAADDDGVMVAVEALDAGPLNDEPAPQPATTT
jgi:type IV secretion system protein VirD4